LPSPRVLITGFEPFAGSTRNPSLEVISQLASKPDWIAQHSVVTATLPVDTATAPEQLHALLDKHTPQVVILLGESARAKTVTLERIAVNLLDFRIPDNQGVSVTDQPVEPQGPAALWATLPVKQIAAKHPDVALSMSAGTYLCNQVMYLALRWAQGIGDERRVGFVHLPSLPEQVVSGERNEPSRAAADSTPLVSAVVEESASPSAK